MSPRSVRGPLVAVLAAALCWACPILGRDEEPLPPGPMESEDRIPVVDDVGPFDPSEAVDDDGDVRPIEASARKDESAREKGGERDSPGEPVADEAEAAVRGRVGAATGAAPLVKPDVRVSRIRLSR